MTSWASDELHDVQLHDTRLNARYIRIVDACAHHPTATLPMAMGSEAACKGLYRLFANTKVTADRLLTPHQRRTRERARTAGFVLLIQDTTSCDLTAKKRMTGLGRLEHEHCRGLFVHSTLAVSIDGVPLGLLDQYRWARPFDKRTDPRPLSEIPTAEKESQRWLDSLARSQRLIAPSVTTVTLMDREGDFYDVLAAPRRANAHLLLRARWNRRVTDADAWAEKQWDAIAATPEAMRLTVEIPRQHKGTQQVPARTATLAIRYGTLTLAAPAHLGGASLVLQHILVEEVDPPAGVEPICWRLLTTLPITSPEVAALYVEWYTYRWRIERFHFVLKSGCGIEALQFQSRDRWECALVIYSIIAWRLLALLYAARAHPDRSCAEVLTTAEWQVATLATAPRQPLPARPPTGQQAVGMLARLGGFRGRKCDSEPGITVLWRGWQRLQDLLVGYRLAQQGRTG